MKLIATALACGAVACWSAVPKLDAAGAGTPTPVADFAITYQRSGGLRPMPYRLAIRPGRHGTLTAKGELDERSRTVRFQVSRAKVRRLRDALARAAFGTVGTPDAGVCADCYVYAISYEGHDVIFGDDSMPKRLRETVALLEGLVDAHRPRH